MTDDILDAAETRMQGALDNLKKDFSSLRTGRAHPSLLDGIQVDAYGAKSPMNSVASVSAPESRLLSVNVWDTSLAAAVEKAIRDSDLGLNPMREGNIIRIAVPELTEERRRDIVKVAGQYAEQARVAIRNVRRDGMDSIKKADLPEDDSRRENDKVQKLTDTFIKQVDSTLQDKEKEVMQV